MTKLSPVLLPTDDASELYLNTTGQLHIYKDNFGETPNFKQHHLYLCSNIEIKEGDWHLHFYNGESVISKSSKAGAEAIKNEPGYKKIEFTTDPKLIADGVPEIPKLAYVNSRKDEAYLLQEFVKRYNQNNNHKSVDVDAIIKDELNLVHKVVRCRDFDLGFKTGALSVWDKALQSNAGRFSLEDMRKAMIILAQRINKELGEEKPSGFQVNKFVDDYLQSLIKEQPKGDIVIECEMENEQVELHTLRTDAVFKERIKLDTNGQPVIYFK